MEVNGTRLQNHFGSAIEKVKIHHLLHMTSGIADYDGEAYAHDQFHNRNKDFGPVEIIGQYVNGSLDFEPGSDQRYCSTNYILLGLALARHAVQTPGAWSWKALAQKAVIPHRDRDGRNEFVTKGTCEDHTPVHGFMESYSTASLPPQDVWNVSCVGGWTAGNYLGSVSDVAKFTRELYGGEILSSASLKHMTNFSSPSDERRGVSGGFKFYGMGTFSLDWSIGGDNIAYGHVGDTYGYQSQTTYFPKQAFALSVATNIETTSQAQPADFTCQAFHAVLAALDGSAVPTCTFTVPRRFIGTCNCK